jgi:hypothetical protein
LVWIPNLNLNGLVRNLVGMMVTAEIQQTNIAMVVAIMQNVPNAEKKLCKIVKAIGFNFLLDA